MEGLERTEGEMGTEGDVGGRTRRPAEGRLRGAGLMANGEGTGGRREGMADGSVEGNGRYAFVGRRVERWAGRWL